MAAQPFSAEQARSCPGTWIAICEGQTMLDPCTFTTSFHTSGSNEAMQVAIERHREASSVCPRPKIKVGRVPDDEE